MDKGDLPGGEPVDAAMDVIPDVPVMDVGPDVVVDATPDVMVDAGPACTGEEPFCMGTNLVRCEVDGTRSAEPGACTLPPSFGVTVPAGCVALPEVLANAPEVDAEVDGDTLNFKVGDEVMSFPSVQTLPSSGGRFTPEHVFCLQSFETASGSRWRFRGIGGVAIYSLDTMRIRGTIDVSALGTDPGPGGFLGGLASASGGGRDGKGRSPGRGGSEQGLCDGGGGGGGNLGRGGNGGADGNGAAAVGGLGVAIESGRLTGGSGGGAGSGATSPDLGGAGGAGGGVLHLLSTNRLELLPGAKLIAGGGGGAGGNTRAIMGITDTAGAGGGGGAGGAISLHAPIIMAAGASADVRGGGGGGAGTAELGAGPVGTPGTNASQAPAGSPAGGAPSGGFGAGASSDGSDGGAAQCRDIDALTAQGGGGGGGSGYVHIRAKIVLSAPISLPSGVLRCEAMLGCP